MGMNDGSIVGTTKIVDAGPASERFNLVLVAEGYRQEELAQFAADASHFVAGLFATAPFDRHRCAINVYRLDVASDESGADDPASCAGGTGAAPRTYFDATFCSSGIPRALTVDSLLVLQTVTAQVPQFHSAQVIVNSPKYGGTGGQVGVSSTATQKADGTPVDWREILIHEMGHSIFGLADEYEYLQGCDFAEPAHDVWTFGEPAQPNVTKSPTAAGKWADLVNTVNLPTTSNADCAHCDPQPSPSAFWVGTFEGAGTYHCGLYRPMFDCKMRKLSVPFCAQCARVISEFLAPFDPTFCLSNDSLDHSKWVAVATILFGVIQDGGGVVIVGGKPIPIDPWGPLRQSLWGALANPRSAAPEVRDAAVGIALQQLATLVPAGADRTRIETTAERMVAPAVERIASGVIR